MAQVRTKSSRPDNVIVRDLGALVFTVVLCAVPFLGQAFHMDDNFYMDMARNVKNRPLYPNDMPYVFEGGRWVLADMGSHSHPPLQAYFLALLQRWAGERPGREWLYHSSALFYPVLAVVSMYFLAGRFVDRPVWPSMVLAVSPLFLVMQHTLMTDVPTLAFWLASISTFMWASERESRGLYGLSSFFIFASMFTSYQTAVLVPLLAFYQIRKKNGYKGWTALLTPVLGMAVWFAINYFHYHRFLLWDTIGYIQSRETGTANAFATRLGALLLYQGWLLIFPLFPLLLFGRVLRGRPLALSALAAVYVAQAVVPDYRPAEKAILVVGLVSGAFLCIKMALLFGSAFRFHEANLDWQFLGLWYFVVVFYCTFILTEGSARYVLPLAPPLIIWFFQGLQVQEVVEYRSQKSALLNSGMIASGALVLSLAWGLALSHADREFAGIYPRVALEMARLSDLPLYYAGEWGFRYYCRQAGMHQLPVDENQVRGGSLVIRPSLALPYDLPKGLASMLMPFRTLTYDVKTPLRLLDRESKAGFYSTGWGLLPFSLSRRNLERVEVAQVNFLVERLPSAQVESLSGVRPWPGYITLEDREPLALLAKPGTKIVYAWTEDTPLSLELKCGVSLDSYADRKDASFTFEIRHRNAKREVLAFAGKTLFPGRSAGDRKWQPLILQLHSSPEGGYLEFRYFSDTAARWGTGAFAEAYLRKPQ